MKLAYIIHSLLILAVFSFSSVLFILSVSQTHSIDGSAVLPKVEVSLNKAKSM
jgi:hypothetical protein